MEYGGSQPLTGTDDATAHRWGMALARDRVEAAIHIQFIEGSARFRNWRARRLVWKVHAFDSRIQIRHVAKEGPWIQQLAAGLGHSGRRANIPQGDQPGLEAFRSS